MRKIGTIALLATALCLASPAAQAETIKSRINPNNTKTFSFIPDDDGVVQITVMAKKNVTYILIALNSDGEITWCSAVSDERMIRCEFSGIGSNVVNFGLLTISGRTPVDINVTGPTNEFVLRPDDSAPHPVQEAAAALRERLLDSEGSR